MVTKKGSWYYYGEQRMAQGRDKTLLELAASAPLAECARPNRILHRTHREEAWACPWVVFGGAVGALFRAWFTYDIVSSGSSAFEYCVFRLIELDCLVGRLRRRRAMRWRAVPRRRRPRWRLLACRIWMRRRSLTCWRRRSLQRQGLEQFMLLMFFFFFRVLAWRGCAYTGWIHVD